MNSNLNLFEIQNLTFSYRKGSPIFENLKAVIPAGKICILQGYNGSGKTTLLKLLCGLQNGYTGNIKHLQHSDEKNGKVIYLHQDPYLFSGTVRSNILFPLKNHKIDKMQREEIADKLISEFALEKVANTSVRRISGGEAKLTALARGIAAGADTLLIDEPTANIDKDNRVKIIDKILELRNSGFSFVIATHDRDFSKVVGDCVFELEKDKLVLVV